MPISPIEAGVSSVTPAVLAHIGMRLGRDALKWDADKTRFVGDMEADKLLAPHLRGSWRLDIF